MREWSGVRHADVRTSVGLSVACVSVRALFVGCDPFHARHFSANSANGFGPGTELPTGIDQTGGIPYSVDTRGLRNRPRPQSADSPRRGNRARPQDVDVQWGSFGCGRVADSKREHALKSTKLEARNGLVSFQHERGVFAYRIEFAAKK